MKLPLKFISSFRRPLPGETVVLQCAKCKRIFSGPNPDVFGEEIPSIFEKREKPVCPDCGSKKVERYFGVMY